MVDKLFSFLALLMGWQRDLVVSLAKGSNMQRLGGTAVSVFVQLLFWVSEM